MTRAAFCAALLTTALPLPAIAQDARLQEREFDPQEVVRIEGKTNVQATIRFGEDEVIENVAIGDSQSWQVTPNKRADLLFVKPLSPKASTNMTVVTNRFTYFFDLVASPAHAKPLYVLSFTYPPELLPEPEPEPTQNALGTANDLEMAAATDPYAVVDPAQLNFEWARSGERALLPSEVFDDGEATFLTWPTGRDLPAILVVDHEGTEGPVNFAVRGDVIVVDGVPSTIILRSGDETARLTHRGPVRQQQQATQTARAGG